MFGLTPINKRGDISKYDNFPDFNNMVDFYNVIDGFFNDNFTPFKSQQSNTFKVDLKENDKQYIVDAELPGFKKEDIRLDLENNQLTISVSKQDNKDEENENYIYRERRQCSMQRSIYLNNITGENVSAKFENGILNVVVPKKDISENKTQIQID